MALLGNANNLHEPTWLLMGADFTHRSSTSQVWRRVYSCIVHGPAHTKAVSFKICSPSSERSYTILYYIILYYTILYYTITLYFPQDDLVRISVGGGQGTRDREVGNGLHLCGSRLVGWHYLSDATCLIRLHLLYVCFSSCQGAP